MTRDDLRTIGVVVDAHGLQGTLKVNPLSDFPERFDSLREVFLARGDGEPREMQVKRVRWAGKSVLITLHEISVREQALDWRGAEMCVADSESWKLPQGVFYESDLIGFKGIDERGQVIGILSGVVRGAQDILEFEHRNQSLLVPFVEEWVGDVDPSARTILIRNWQLLAEPESIDDESDRHDD